MGRSGGHALVSQRPGGSPLSACPRGTCRGHLRVSTGHYGAGHHSRGRSHHVPDLFGVSLRCSALVCGAGMSTRRTTLSSRAGGAPRLTGGVTAPDKAILKGCLVREVWSRRPPRTLCFRSSALVHEAMQAGLAVTGMLWSGTRRPMAGDDLSRLSSKVTVPDRQF